jgi:hypothetical protein
MEASILFFSAGGRPASSCVMARRAVGTAARVRWLCLRQAVPGCLLYYFRHPLGGKRQLDKLAGCQARRVGQRGAAAAPPGWRTRGVLCAGCGPPTCLRTPVGCQLQLQLQRQRRQAGAPEEPREPGARHPSPGACPWDASLTAVAAAAPPSWLRPTSAVARPSRSRALTCPGERRPCAQPFCSVGSVSRAFTHWTHPHSIP